MKGVNTSKNGEGARVHSKSRLPGKACGGETPGERLRQRDCGERLPGKACAGETAGEDCERKTASERLHGSDCTRQQGEDQAHQPTGAHLDELARITNAVGQGALLWAAALLPCYHGYLLLRLFLRHKPAAVTPDRIVSPTSRAARFWLS